MPRHQREPLREIEPQSVPQPLSQPSSSYHSLQAKLQQRSLKRTRNSSRRDENNQRLAYEADNESPRKKRSRIVKVRRKKTEHKCKRPRATNSECLILGAGNFSFPNAFVEKEQEKKHLGFGESVTATELLKPEQLHSPIYAKCTKNLQRHGVQLKFGVDARYIHRQFRGRRFPKIHFNFPHDGKSYNERTLPTMLADFFASASKLQLVGDRIYMALPKIEGDPGKNNYYKGYAYGVYDAARYSRYRLVKKRQFGEKRYPGYQHEMTTEYKSAEVAENAREYIFEKTTLTPINILHSWPKPIDYRVYDRNYRCLPEIMTDSDSSDDEEYENKTDQKEHQYAKRLRM